MNLSESMKYVLKTRGQSIFTEFWKQDLKIIFKDVGVDFYKLALSSKGKFHDLKQQGVGKSYSEFKASATETFFIMKLVPRRMQQGFAYFRDDFLKELDQLADAKQKTVFSLKVLGSLSRFILTAVYGMKKSQAGFTFKGLRHRNAFTQFLVAELVFKMSQVFILRFLNEVEKEVDDQEAIKNLRYFKNILSDSSNYGDPESINAENEPGPGERAFEIVENFKNYIATGER